MPNYVHRGASLLASRVHHYQTYLVKTCTVSIRFKLVQQLFALKVSVSQKVAYCATFRTEIDS
jgi:hypothetical protein